MEEQSQVEELQKNLQEQGSKADDVSPEMFVLCCLCLNVMPAEMLATTTESQIPIIPHLANKDGSTWLQGTAPPEGSRFWYFILKSNSQKWKGKVSKQSYTPAQLFVRTRLTQCIGTLDS